MFLFHTPPAERFWMTAEELPEFRRRRQARGWCAAAVLGALFLLWQGSNSSLVAYVSAALLAFACAAGAFARGWAPPD